MNPISRALRADTTRQLLIGLLAGIPLVGLQYWIGNREPKRALTLELQAAAVIGDATAADTSLALTYAGRPIPGAVKLSFSLTNTGKRPIRDGEVVLPPYASIDSSSILESELVRTSPSDLVATISVDSTRQRAHIRTRLLNPKDRVEFALLVLGRRIPNVTAGIHAEGLSEVEFADRRRSVPARRSWVSLDVLAFAFGEVLTLLLLARSLVTVGYERRARKTWKHGPLSLRQPVAPFLYIAVVEDLFRQHPSLIRFVEDQLSGLDPTKPIPTQHLQVIGSVVSDYVEQVKKASVRTALINALWMIALAVYFIWSTRG